MKKNRLDDAFKTAFKTMHIKDQKTQKLLIKIVNASF